MNANCCPTGAHANTACLVVNKLVLVLPPESPPPQALSIAATIEHLWEAQTPQVFRRQLLLDAYAQRGGEPATDDAQLVERLGHPVTVVPGSPLNVKITSREDLRLVEQALKVLPKPKLSGPRHPFADDDMWR